ncbi:MAG: efflux RND transporter permease subunit [Rikenellaceae bacterium]
MDKFFINRPIFAIVISIIIVVLGLVSIYNLPVEQYPNITPPVVTVNASYEGADAITVDESVASPISEAIMGVDNLIYMQTTSANDGSMTLQATFDIGTDPDLNSLFTQNKVNSTVATLPTSVQDQGVTTQKAMTGFLLVYALWSDGEYDVNYLSNYAYLNIQNELLKTNGVGEVQIMGSGQYAMRIWVKPDLLKYYNVSIEDISTAIEEQSEVFAAGKLSAEPVDFPTYFTYTVTTPSQINKPEEYENIIIKTLDDGGQLLLKDIATVNLGSELYGVKSLFDGEHPSALIVVFQTSGSNAVEVGNRVSAIMDEISQDFPDGINISTMVDSTESIKDGIKEIFYTILFALLLVIIIIYLFIQDARATLIPLIAIPVSLIGAFLLFPLFGFSVNIISLLGLVLSIGLVVDDAIVVVEAVQQHIERGLSPTKATIAAMHEVRSPIIATTVILLAVFLPISFSGGITGEMFQQFTITIAVAVSISAFNALTLSPALCSILLKERKVKDSGFFGHFNRWFKRRVDGCNRFTATLSKHLSRSLLFIAIIGGAIFLVSKHIPVGFLPEEDQGYIMVSVALPNAASVQRTERVVVEVTEILSSFKEVEHVAGAAGYDLLAGISSTNNAVLFVKLVDYSKRKITSMEFADKLNIELYFAVPQAQIYAFGPPSIPGLGISSGLSFVIEQRDGGSLNELAMITEELLDSIRNSAEISTVMTQFNADVPQRRLIIDRDNAMREGVDIADLHTTLSTFLGGSYINKFNRFGRLYETYIQADASYRKDANDLNSYFIENSSGDEVPLSTFVRVIDTVGVEFVDRFNLNRSIAVNASTSKGVSSTEAMVVVENIANAMLPDGYALSWSGISYQDKEASNNTWLLYAMTILFVFLVLAALYDSWAMPLSILLGVPFAIFGAMLLVWLFHKFNVEYINNLFMQISLIMLIGLSAKNAILIIEYANIIFFEKGKTLVEAALEGAKLRIRPILMTTFAFVIGVLPLVFASGVYSVARNIIGVALIGGIVVATMLGIFIYPLLYALFGKIANFEKKRTKMAEKQEQI